jgi:hypothetical protein
LRDESLEGSEFTSLERSLESIHCCYFVCVCVCIC